MYIPDEGPFDQNTQSIVFTPEQNRGVASLNLLKPFHSHWLLEFALRTISHIWKVPEAAGPRDCVYILFLGT